MSQINYNFPKTKFVELNTMRAQVEHVLSEADELREIFSTVPGHCQWVDQEWVDGVWEEVYDILHSIETFIRMDTDSFVNARNKIIQKNTSRGYYVQEDIVPVITGYEKLHEILIDALNQAQSGKGSERHGQGLPFDQQPIIVIPKLQNSDIGLMYQAIKKLQESQRMSAEAAIKERLGAINYIAASIIFLQEKGEK